MVIKPIRRNIELADEITDEEIVIKGKKLTLRWFGELLLVWSEEDYPSD